MAEKSRPRFCGMPILKVRGDVNDPNCHSDKEKYFNAFNVARKANIPEISIETLMLQTTLNHRVPGSSPGAPTKLFKDIAGF